MRLPCEVEPRPPLTKRRRGAAPDGATGGRTPSDTGSEASMAMSAHHDWKGGTTMVMLADRWIGCGLNVAPACPWEEFVRRP